MLPNEIRELFDYLIDTRAGFVAKFREIGWEEFVRDRGATWGSMRAIFLHLLDDEEGWLGFAAQGRSTVDAPDRKPDDYTTFEQVAEDNTRVGAATRALLGRVTEAALAQEVAFAERSGVTRRPMEKIMMHAFVDELAHLGELIALFWQLDVPPPYLDWLDYHVG